MKIIDTMCCFENTETFQHVVGNDEKSQSNVNIHLNVKQTFSGCTRVPPDVAAATSGAARVPPDVAAAISGNSTLIHLDVSKSLLCDR